jgi:hypothetical protein
MKIPMNVKSLNSVSRFLFCCFLAALFSVSVQAQDEIDKVFQNGKADGEYLLKGYLNPFMQTISLGLNQGWYNTAKTHKVAGLDLTTNVNLMYFPSSDYYFNVDNSKLKEIELLSGPSGTPQSGNVPTMFGPDKAPTYRSKSDGSEFEGPPGIDMKKNVGKFLPVPTVNFGFGLPKSIELRLRFCPKIDLGDKSSFNLYGIGIMHDIKQYIPGIKLLPFDLSVFAGYTHMQMKTDLSGNFNSIDGKAQEGIFSVNATTIQGVISKKISVITVYGSIGYNIAKSNLAMKGSYDFDDNGSISTDPAKPEHDPVNLDFAASGPRVSGGVRLKLWVFTFHGDYTLQKYSSLSAGFGINIR